MNLWKANICSHKLDVQEGNITDSHFYRIRDHFTGCWFANGRYTCYDLREVVTEVLHSSKYTHQAVRDHCRKEKVDDQVPRSRARSETNSTNPNIKSKRDSNRKVDDLSNVDHVVTSAKPSQFESPLYILEDIEAVIKMIIKGRSPMMRHVSGTHRESGKMCCSTESTWTPRSKSNMLTPETSSLTCCPKAVSCVMSGVIFFDCLTL